MPVEVDLLAHRIVRDVAYYTRGKAILWVPVQTIAHRLMLRDEAVLDQALEFAHAKGWVDVEGGHSVCLTAAGQSFLKRR